MTQTHPLIPFLQRVREAFIALTAPDVELFPDWDAAWAPHARAEDDPEPGARIGDKGLLHALTLSRLYCDEPVERVCEAVAEMRETSRSPDKVAAALRACIVGHAYEGRGEPPGPDEWSRNRMLRLLTLKVGERYLLECLHAWSREVANVPERRATRRGEFIYSCFVPPAEGALSAGTPLHHAIGPDEDTHTQVAPTMLMLLVRGLSPLAEDEERLGAAIVAVLHYGNVRFFSTAAMRDVIRMVAEIESE